MTSLDALSLPARQGSSFRRETVFWWETEMLLAPTGKRGEREREKQPPIHTHILLLLWILSSSRSAPSSAADPHPLLSRSSSSSSSPVAHPPPLQYSSNQQQQGANTSASPFSPAILCSVSSLLSCSLLAIFSC